MSNERKPRRDSGGHITIPPELRPFGGKEGAGPARVREKSPGAEELFTKIVGELGDEASDAQVLDPGRGVGNAAAYVGPTALPETVVGKGVTSKVKIDAGKAKSDPPPAMPAEERAEGAGAVESSPWAKAPVPMLDAGDLPSALMPRSVDGGVVESKRPEVKEKRYGLLALAIGAVVVGLGVVVMMKMGEAPDGPVSGSVPVAGPAPPVSPSGTGSGASPAAVPSGEAVAPVGTSEPAASGVPSAGAVAPTVPSAPRPKARDEDPYDAAPPQVPAPVKTGAPSAPPLPTVTPNVLPPPSATSQIFSPVPQY